MAQSLVIQESEAKSKPNTSKKEDADIPVIKKTRLSKKISALHSQLTELRDSFAIPPSEVFSRSRADESMISIVSKRYLFSRFFILSSVDIKAVV